MIFIGYVRLFLTFVLLNRHAYMARTVTVTLGPHYDAFVKNGIESGKYNNVSEMVRAALRHLEEDEAKLNAFCTAIDEGDASPDVEDFDEERFVRVMKEGRGTRIFANHKIRL